MTKKYNVEKEYNLREIVQYNLRKWWLAAIFGIMFAAVLGVHKYQATYPFLDEVRYGNIWQVRTDLYINPYSEETTAERVNTVVKIASSNKVYQQMIQNTGYDLSFANYQQMYVAVQGEVSNVVSLYVSYPVNYGNFAILDEEAAKDFASELVVAVDQVTQDVIGQETLLVLDKPYVVNELEKTEETISKGGLWKRVIKESAIGFVLGIVVEVILYTVWLLTYKKPKNADEIRQCIDAPIIDVFKNDNDNEDAFKKVALFVFGHEENVNEISAKRVNCMNLQCSKRDVAYKLAMSYAAEQKKTLLIDLSSGGVGGDEAHSISKYILGEATEPTPLELSPYLDGVCRNRDEEKGYNIVTNKRFEEYLASKSGEYEYIVIGSSDLAQCAEGYAVSNFCDKNILACERKNIKNNTLYHMKNTADVNEIKIDGILVYE